MNEKISDKTQEENDIKLPEGFGEWVKDTFKW